jgi:hypothetical protein
MSVSASLLVSQAELTQALKPFAKLAKSKQVGEAILMFASGQLHLYFTGMDTWASAEGAWNGQARVKCDALCRLAKVPPVKDPVVIHVDGDRINIGGSFMPCVWEPVAPRDLFTAEAGVPIQAPINPNLSLLVSMMLDFTDEEIVKSGLADHICKARTRKETLISRAAHELAELEITRVDLRKLVDERLRGKSRGFGKTATRNEPEPAAAPVADYHLLADRGELLAALSSITTFKRRPGTGRLKLSFEEGELRLSMPSVDTGVTAQGTWPTAVWVEARILWALASVPPSGDPVPITFQDGRVRIGSSVAVATSHKP